MLTPNGNVLWECISYIDDKTIEAVNGLGGVDAITLCHPHFYDSMVEWSYAFGKVPIYLPSLAMPSARFRYICLPWIASG